MARLLVQGRQALAFPPSDPSNLFVCLSLFNAKAKAQRFGGGRKHAQANGFRT